MEVVYEGIRLTPAQIAASALQEGVHVVGLSILSGSHRELIPSVIEALREAGVGDVPVIVGGIIPDGRRGAAARRPASPPSTRRRTSTSRASCATSWRSSPSATASRRRRSCSHIRVVDRLSTGTLASWSVAIAQKTYSFRAPGEFAERMREARAGHSATSSRPPECRRTSRTSSRLPCCALAQTSGNRGAEREFARAMTEALVATIERVQREPELMEQMRAFNREDVEGDAWRRGRAAPVGSGDGRRVDVYERGAVWTARICQTSAQAGRARLATAR